MELILYFIICIGATTAGAISGLGGGVIIKPVMDAVSSMPVANVSFLSSCTVLAMSIVSLFISRKGEVKIEKRRGTLLAVGAAVGGTLGKYLFAGVKAMASNDGFIGTVQNVVLTLLMLGVLAYVLNKQRIRSLQVQNAAACVAIGLVLGVLSAFLGVGGGPFNLAALYFFFSMDTKTAALNSLYIILFSQSMAIVSTFIQHSVPAVTWAVLLVMALGGVAGGLVGRALNKKMSVRQVDVLFIIMLIFIAGVSVYNVTQYAAMLP